MSHVKRDKGIYIEYGEFFRRNGFILSDDSPPPRFQNPTEKRDEGAGGRKVARTIIDGVGRRFRGRKATFFLPLRLTYAKRVRNGTRRPRRVDTTRALLILFACNPSTSHPRCRITKSSGRGFCERTRRSVMLARVIEGDINARVYRFRVRLFTAHVATKRTLSNPCGRVNVNARKIEVLRAAEVKGYCKLHFDIVTRAYRDASGELDGLRVAKLEATEETWYFTNKATCFI